MFLNIWIVIFIYICPVFTLSHRLCAARHRVMQPLQADASPENDETLQMYSKIVHVYAVLVRTR